MADSRLRAGGAQEGGAAAPESLAASERPIFYFDFSSPECWLAAERVNHVLSVVPVWTPVRVETPVPSPRPASDEFADLAHRMTAHGLPTPRLPDPSPEDLEVVLRAATFAAGSGRVVAFSLAALRQAFAAGRDLSQVDNVLIAAAACELHPRAVLKGIESQFVQDRLRIATAMARRRGVDDVPALATSDWAWQGPGAVDEASNTLIASG